MSKMIAKRALTFLILCCLFNVAGAQRKDCERMLQDVKNYCSKGNYKQAKKMYNQLSQQCPDYARNVAKDIEECKKKQTPTKLSKPLVVVAQQKSDFIYGSEVFFPAKGDVCSDVQVTCNDWFSSKPDNCDWLSVTENGNYLVIRCAPNPNQEERTCTLGIICDNGTHMGEVVVRQEARKTSSKSIANLPEQTIDDRFVSVMIYFERGNAKFRFDNNVWNILKALDDNKDFGLQIEVPMRKKLFAMMLAKNRIKKITEYFVASGIDPNRISSIITMYDECQDNIRYDSAFVKITLNN